MLLQDNARTSYLFIIVIISETHSEVNGQFTAADPLLIHPNYFLLRLSALESVNRSLCPLPDPVPEGSLLLAERFPHHRHNGIPHTAYYTGERQYHKDTGCSENVTGSICFNVTKRIRIYGINTIRSEDVLSHSFR